MKRAIKYLAWTLAGMLLAAIGTFVFAYFRAQDRYNKTWSIHAATFPIPFPLDEADLAVLREERLRAGAPAADPLADVDLDAAALDRAIQRGEHLLGTRIGCRECHGNDFGGKAVIDQALVGRWVAPNLTAGAGSVTRGFTATEWDHAVRHGVRHTGLTSSMPSDEFSNLSDHELSDVVAYVRSRPPVDRDLGPSRLGVVFTFVVAFQGLPAFTINHDAPHAVEPPAATVSAEYGEHLVQVCRGCHGANLSGGKVSGDPNMPIVANLTPHATGIQGWSEADFVRALREGVRKDGTRLLDAMPWRVFGHMSDTELKAIYAYLQTQPPIEKGRR
jgi:mono/diheme cytochrome c family protein